MDYPYNVNAYIEKSFFMDKTLQEYDDDKYIKKIKLTPEQVALLIPFFLNLEAINTSNNFMELKKQEDVIAFSVQTVFINKETDEYEGIYVWIHFFSDKKLGDMSTYNNDYNFWSVHNIAIYSLIDYKFRGWVF